MKKNWAKKTLAFSLAILLALCCGCGKKGKSAEPTPTATPGMDIAVPVATPEPIPEAGGEVRMYMPTNADILDPLSVNTEEMLSLFSMVFESLISVGSDGTLSPELAENWSSDGNGVWTINLRGGVNWHSGDKMLTARDVVQTFERLKELGDDCYYAYCAEKIESIDEVNNSTLTVTMKSPGYASLYALTFPIMMNGAVSTAPIGTGPYRVTGASGGRLTLNVNDGWWKQRPYIDSFVFLERDSNSTALASYSAGQLDIVPTSATIAGRYRQENKTGVLDVMTQSAEMMLLNSTSPTLMDIRVKQAIAYALDRSRIISNIYMNRAQASDVPIAPDSWLYDSRSKVYDYDIVKARTLLEEAGWTDVDDDGRLEKNGMALSEMNIQLLVNESSDTTRRDAASAIAEQLEELGITVEVVTAAYTAGKENGEFQTLLAEGNYDVALIGINLPRDGDLTDVIRFGGSANYGNYSNSELLGLAANMMKAPDETTYRDAASAFQLKFVEEMPFIMLYFRLNSIIYSTEIKGLAGAREPDIMRAVDKWYIYDSTNKPAN